MWRRHGGRRKQAHGTENNLFIKGWDVGCGGKLCSQAVETEWGLLGWPPATHHCQGSRMVACPGKFGKEGMCSSQAKGQIDPELLECRGHIFHFCSLVPTKVPGIQ